MAEPWVELRVHGVSGTPAESMLDFDRVKQVAGDEFGRLFRRVDERDDPIPGAEGQVVEAYHWGKFTSGSWSQAIWLLLAPFGIINAAQFSLEPPTSSRAKIAYVVASAMLRLVGLTLTVLFVLGTAVITLDLWAWQRINIGAAGQDRAIDALALLAPVALLVMCFSLGRSRLVGSDDDLGPPHAAKADHLDEDDRFDQPLWERQPPSDLVRPGFLGGDVRAPALRLMHLATGLSIVAVLGFAPRRDLDDAVALVGYWAAFALLALCAVGVALVGDPERSASVALQGQRARHLRAAIRRASFGVGRALAVAGGLLVGGAVVHAVVLPTLHDNTLAHYPGIDLVAYLTVLAAMFGMVVLLIANAILAWAERGSPARTGNARFAPFARGFACTLLASLGIFVGVGYVGAFGVTAASALATDEHTVQAPEIQARIVYAWGLTLFVLAALAAFGWLRFRKRAPILRARVEADFQRGDAQRVPRRWANHIASAMWAARLKNSLVGVLTAFSAVGWILSAATGWELLPQLWGEHDLWVVPGWLTWLTQPVTVDDPRVGLIMWLGTLSLTGLATALLFLGRTSLAGESTRRGVNVLWDVFAFWPRSAHPFVPPAYSQRAVKDIEKRVTWYLDQRRDDASDGGKPAAGRHVVLCAHSQGSLLSFTALLRLGTATASPDGGAPTTTRVQDEVGLVTFGSQLQVLFARAFPAYVNLLTIDWLANALGGAWRNLYRDTDYLAGPVLSWKHQDGPEWWIGQSAPAAGDGASPTGEASRQEYGADWRLLDPPLPDAQSQLRPMDQLRRHSDYWADPAWPDAVREARLTPAPGSSR